MKINWGARGIVGDVERFIKRCDMLARTRNAFDINCSEEIYTYLKSHPILCENFIIEWKDFYAVVARNEEALKIWEKMR